MQLRKTIQEYAMYSARGRRDAEVESLGEPYSGKIRNIIDDQELASDNTGNELLQSLAGYDPSIQFPDARSYGEEIGQFDQKLTTIGRQQYEDNLTPSDKKLRKMVVDNLFSRTGSFKIPVIHLTNPVGGRAKSFKMYFQLWVELFPEKYLEANNLDSTDPQYADLNQHFEDRAEAIFNSMGGSWHAGDGDTLVPLQGITKQDQEYFNQVILKVLNNDPQYV